MLHHRDTSILWPGLKNSVVNYHLLLVLSHPLSFFFPHPVPSWLLSESPKRPAPKRPQPLFRGCHPPLRTPTTSVRVPTPPLPDRRPSPPETPTLPGPLTTTPTREMGTPKPPETPPTPSVRTCTHLPVNPSPSFLVPPPLRTQPLHPTSPPLFWDPRSSLMDPHPSSPAPQPSPPGPPTLSLNPQLPRPRTPHPKPPTHLPSTAPPPRTPPLYPDPDPRLSQLPSPLHGTLTPSA